jgi:hypothetical protein
VKPSLRSDKAPLTIPLSSISTLESRSGSRALHGTLLGAGIGAGLALIGSVFVAADGEVKQPSAAATLGGILIPLSSLIGLIAGLDTPRWRSLDW